MGMTQESLGSFSMALSSQVIQIGRAFLFKMYSLKKIVYVVYFWMGWVFIALCRLLLVAVSGASFLLPGTGFALWWLLFCGT